MRRRSYLNKRNVVIQFISIQNCSHKSLVFDEKDSRIEPFAFVSKFIYPMETIILTINNIVVYIEAFIGKCFKMEESLGFHCLLARSTQLHCSLIYIFEMGISKLKRSTSWLHGKHFIKHIQRNVAQISSNKSLFSRQTKFKHFTSLMIKLLNINWIKRGSLRLDSRSQACLVSDETKEGNENTNTFFFVTTAHSADSGLQFIFD